MNAPSEIAVLSLVCNKLEQANVPYMLTGSFASNFYTVPRMTRDIDIVIELQRTNKERLIQVLKNEFYISPDAINEAINHQSMFNVIHNESVFKIDFIIRKNASYRETEFQRRKQIDLDNQLIWIVSPEDLIISKLFWAKDSSSQIQLRDIQNLLRSVKDLDQTYLNTWIQKLQLESTFKKVDSHG